MNSAEVVTKERDKEFLTLFSQPTRSDSYYFSDWFVKHKNWKGIDFLYTMENPKRFHFQTKLKKSDEFRFRNSFQDSILRLLYNKLYPKHFKRHQIDEPGIHGGLVTTIQRKTKRLSLKWIWNVQSAKVCKKRKLSQLTNNTLVPVINHLTQTVWLR